MSKTKQSDPIRKQLREMGIGETLSFPKQKRNTVSSTCNSLQYEGAKYRVNGSVYEREIKVTRLS